MKRNLVAVSLLLLFCGCDGSGGIDDQDELSDQGWQEVFGEGGKVADDHLFKGHVARD